MNLNDVLNIVSYFTNKEQSGATFTPQQYNDILPLVNLSLFRKYYAVFEATQTITDALEPFKVYMGRQQYTNSTGTVIPATAPLKIDTNGYANIPADYKHYSALTWKQAINKPGCDVQIKHRPVLVLTDQEFDAYKAATSMISYKYPVCNFQAGIIRFLPVDLQMVDFVYLRHPATPVFGYTINPVTDYYTYNPATSTELEWKDEQKIEIIYMLLEAVGINISLETITQYAMAKTGE